MSAEATIYTTLAPLVGNRVFPLVAPEGTQLPFIVYQRVSGEAAQFMDGSLPNRENGRFQISVWSATASQSTDISKQAETALCAQQATLQTTVLSGRSAMYDPDTGTYGSMQDFSLWFLR